MPTLPQNVNIIAELNACRSPTWKRFTTTGLSSAPDAADDGVALGGATAAIVSINLREDVWRRTARVTVATRDAAANYTLTVDAQAIATTTGSFATNDSILVELKAKIAADATYGGAAGANQRITSYLIDSTGATTVGTAGGGTAAVALIVTGTIQGDYAIAHSATGTGALAVKADPSTATYYVYATDDGQGTETAHNPVPTEWDLVKDGTAAMTYRGAKLRLATGGLDRLAVEVASIAGFAGDGTLTYTDANSPVVRIGVATRETN